MLKHTYLEEYHVHFRSSDSFIILILETPEAGSQLIQRFYWFVYLWSIKVSIIFFFPCLLRDLHINCPALKILSYFQLINPQQMAESILTRIYPVEFNPKGFSIRALYHTRQNTKRAGH